VATATFGVPAEVVWQYRLDFTNLPEYNPDVSEVQRVQDGAAGSVGGACGPGARYTFWLADAGGTGTRHPVELWVTDATEPTMVAAGMDGGHEAYEEFTVRALNEDACEATLTLWVTLPDGLPDEALSVAAAGSMEQISKELRLMQQVLEDTAREDPARTDPAREDPARGSSSR
jgi:hypothetical protein